MNIVLKNYHRKSVLEMCYYEQDVVSHVLRSVSLKGSAELKSIVTRVALFESHEHKKRVPHLFLLHQPGHLWDRVTQPQGQHTSVAKEPKGNPKGHQCNQSLLDL